MSSVAPKKVDSFSTPATSIHPPLHSCVRAMLDRYFNDLDGHKPGNLYDLVIDEVEQPLLETVLHYTRGNQSKAAEILGMNRTTLRKKLRKYGLD
jgi:Fis family transcriptional regulator